MTDRNWRDPTAGENTRLHQGKQADKRGALSETLYLGRV